MPGALTDEYSRQLFARLEDVRSVFQNEQLEVIMILTALSSGLKTQDETCQQVPQYVCIYGAEPYSLKTIVPGSTPKLRLCSLDLLRPVAMSPKPSPKNRHALHQIESST